MSSPSKPCTKEFYRAPSAWEEGARIFFIGYLFLIPLKQELCYLIFNSLRVDFCLILCYNRIIVGVAKW